MQRGLTIFTISKLAYYLVLIIGHTAVIERHFCLCGNVPEGQDSQRPVGFVTGVATQVTSPKVIFPDVTQRSARI